MHSPVFFFTMASQIETIAEQRRRQAIERINADLQADAPAKKPPILDEDRPGSLDEQGRYVANYFAVKRRLGAALIALLMMAYGVFGIYRNDLPLPLGRRNSLTIHLHDGSAWLMFLALLCAAANFLTLLADHYDTRNNEARYRRFEKHTQHLGWGLFACAILLHLLIRLH